MKNFNPDDPRLTAFALGELEGEELHEIEALVARDPAAARHVESIRAAATGFGEAFEREPAPAVAPIRAIEIEPKRRTPFIPWLFYASTAAAACFFVVLVIRIADPAALKSDENLAAEAALSAPPAPAPATEATGAVRAVPVEQAGSDELRRQSSDFRKEGAAVAGASVEESAAVMAPNTESARDRAQLRDDADAGKSAMAAAPTANEVGEMKDAAKRSRAKKNEGEMRSFESLATAEAGRESTGALGHLSERIWSGEMPASVDTIALLAELGLRGSQESREGDTGNLAQTTLDVSPMPDPEAALVRAVEGFARLIAARTPAGDEEWDRVLADARYAAGSDPKRQAFVALVGEARELVRAPKER